MIYIYDIILNLNKELIEFFEWEKEDKTMYVRRLPMYKVSSNMMRDLLDKEIKIDISFLNDIKNNNLTNISKFEYLTLFTDDKIVLGAVFNSLGELLLQSRLIIEEEIAVLELSNKLSIEEIEYQIIKEKNIDNNNLTRKEKQINKELIEEINTLYLNNKIDKLNYYYYEYYNEICNSKEKVYQSLLNSLENEFNYKHLQLYEVIKLSYSRK